MTTLFNTVQM